MDDYDLSAKLPEKRIEEIEGWRIGITHGRGSFLVGAICPGKI